MLWEFKIKYLKPGIWQVLSKQRDYHNIKYYGGVYIYWASFTEIPTVHSIIIDIITSLVLWTRQMLYSPSYRWGSWGWERLDNKLKYTHLVRGAAWTRTQIFPAFLERTLHFFSHFISSSHPIFSSVDQVAFLFGIFLGSTLPLGWPHSQ